MTFQPKPERQAGDEANIAGPVHATVHGLIALIAMGLAGYAEALTHAGPACQEALSVRAGQAKLPAATLASRFPLQSCCKESRYRERRRAAKKLASTQAD